MLFKINKQIISSNTGYLGVKVLGEYCFSGLGSRKFNSQAEVHVSILGFMVRLVFACCKFGLAHILKQCILANTFPSGWRK